MSKILIIYSTIGGNTQLAVQRIQEELNKANFEVDLVRVDVANASTVMDYELTILASPTYGQGSVEDHFRPFLAGIKKLNLAGKKFAVVGLGDTKYYPEYLTESANLLEEEVKTVKGNLIVPALRIGMPPLKFIDKLVPNWVNKVVLALG